MHYCLLIEAKADEETIGKMMRPFIEAGAANYEDETFLREIGVLEEVDESEDGAEGYTVNKQGKWDWYQIGGRFSEFYPSDEFKARDGADNAPFAFLTAAGVWQEKRTYVRNVGIVENENFDADFWKWYSGLDPDAVITVVDYHN